MINYYNSQISECGAKLRKCRDQTPERLSAVTTILGKYGEDSVKETIDNAIKSKFLNEDADIAPVDIDWITTPNNFVKVMEGKYNDREPKADAGKTRGMAGGRDASTPQPPTLEQVKEYAELKGLRLKTEDFFNHYQTHGWKEYGAPIKDWTSAMCEWERKHRTEDRYIGMIHCDGDNDASMWEREKKENEMRRNGTLKTYQEMQKLKATRIEAEVRGEDTEELTRQIEQLEERIKP